MEKVKSDFDDLLMLYNDLLIIKIVNCAAESSKFCSYFIDLFYSLLDWRIPPC